MSAKSFREVHLDWEDSTTRSLANSVGAGPERTAMALQSSPRTLDFEMPTIPEDPVSIVASQLPNNLSIKALFAIIIFAVIARLFHYTSPQRLTAVLVDTMDKLKKTS
ncbi:hypothetical protein B0H19DRAFT_1251916 [Mycena capillaripes]|nr:hypothetical protein B0H19DRAFT_1251916 [Mycena capillaripes]